MEDIKKEIRLLTIKDIEELTGWATCTINKLMAQQDFPVIKIGKENLVLLESFKQYMSVRRDLRG